MKDASYWYQVSQQDRVVDPALQEELVKRLEPEDVLRLPASHALMASHPREIAEFILKAVQSLD